MGRAPGPTSRAALLAAVVGTVLAAGCGGSLADTDRPVAHTARTPPGDFCAAVQAGAEATRPLAALAGQGDVDRPQLREAAENLRRANADVLATAPAEIRDDVERAVGWADLQLDVLEAAGGDAGTVARDAAVRRRLATQDYAVATARVRAYVSTHCGVDLR